MKKVNVLMSTYNGQRYLKEQIDSVIGQEGVEVILSVRDDCSTDETVNILEDYQKRELLTWYSGERLGAKYSFFDLIKKAKDYEYYAFCDQDDVWQPRKLISAIELMGEYTKDKPLLYCSETMQVDENLNKLPKQTLRGADYLFGQILIKNYANGCTMVFNNSLFIFLKIPNIDEIKNIPYHDHWAYMVCLSCGGKVIYDTSSYILYRQHGDNVIGSRRKIIKKIRENGILNKECRRYHYVCDLYSNYSDYFTLETGKIVKQIINYKDNIWTRLALALNKEIKPINVIEKIIIFFTVLLGRF